MLSNVYSNKQKNCDKFSTSDSAVWEHSIDTSFVLTSAQYIGTDKWTITN